MRYKITFSYDGTNFNGFQKQNGLRTVEEELEKAVSYLNRQKETLITASGRTDKGVHAEGQVANFDLDIEIPLFKIKMGLNSLLPEDIHIITVEQVKDNFHARYMVKEKEYYYLINIGEYNPVSRNYTYQYNKKLNIDKMIDASNIFIGTHDFRSFISGEDKRENSVRTIKTIDLELTNDILKITIIGDGFMKYQIRNIVGSLVEVGNGKKNKEDLIKIMELKDRSKAGVMVPACGLYLKAVKY